MAILPHEIKDAQWSVLHQVMLRTWQSLNGETPMPPRFPQEVINALDDNIKIIYFDLLRLYDATSQIDYIMRLPNFKGIFGTFSELQAAFIPDNLRHRDYAFVLEIIPPSATENIWEWNMISQQWVDTQVGVPGREPLPTSRIPLPDNANGSNGTENFYSRGDHIHPFSQEVLEAFSTLQQAVSYIAAESQARQQADQALQNYINAQVAGERNARQEAILTEAQARQNGDNSLGNAILAIRDMIEGLILGELPTGFITPLITTVKITGIETVIPLSELGMTYNPVSTYAVFISPQGNYPEFMPFGAEVLETGLHIYAQRLINGQIVSGTQEKRRWGDGAKWGDGSKWGERETMFVNILIKEI